MNTPSFPLYCAFISVTPRSRRHLLADLTSQQWFTVAWIAEASALPPWQLCLRLAAPLRFSPATREGLYSVLEMLFSSGARDSKKRRVLGAVTRYRVTAYHCARNAPLHAAVLLLVDVYGLSKTAASFHCYSSFLVARTGAKSLLTWSC